MALMYASWEIMSVGFIKDGGALQGDIGFGG